MANTQHRRKSKPELMVQNDKHRPIARVDDTECKHSTQESVIARVDDTEWQTLNTGVIARADGTE